MIGIYCIKNKINNKIYIGETLDIEKRWKEHISLLNTNSHHSYKLQKEWNEYGEECFEFKSMEVKMVEDAPKSSKKYVLYALEYYYMCKYDSIKNGYNVVNTFLKIVNGNHVSTITMNQPQILNMCFYVAFLNNYHKKVLSGAYNLLKKEGEVDKERFYQMFKWGITRDFLNKCNVGNSKITYESFVCVIQGLTIYNCGIIKPYTFAKSFMQKEFKDQYNYDVVFNFDSINKAKKENNIQKKSSPFKPNVTKLLEHIPKTSGIFCVEDIKNNKNKIFSSNNMNKECRNIYKKLIVNVQGDLLMSEKFDINSFKFTCLCVCEPLELETKLSEYIEKQNTH